MAQKGRYTIINYHFLKFSNKSDKVIKPFLQTDISPSVCRDLFLSFRKKLGDVDTVSEYSVYKHRDLELTVLPDGSSFCHQVLRKPVEDRSLPSTDLRCPKILVVINDKTKVSNDIFPPKYSYDDVYDNIDIVFPWPIDNLDHKPINHPISIVISTRNQTDKRSEARSVKNLGKPSVTTNKDIWCEIYVKVRSEAEVSDVHKCVSYVESCLY